MNCPGFLRSVVHPELVVRSIADDIWSVIDEGHSNQVYDKHAKLYDRLIGSELYNRIAWGTSPKSYSSFAKQAVSFGEGTLLDVGCGSLISTAEIHANSSRNTILCDLSEGMLQAARDRMIAIAGRVPDNLVFLQADLFSLPFVEGSFGAVLCPGMLHVFEDVQAVTRELSRVSTPEAQIFLSSLVADRWIAKQYLALLHRAREVAEPRAYRKMIDLLNFPDSGLCKPVDSWLEGSMMFVRASPGNAGGLLPAQGSDRIF